MVRTVLIASVLLLGVGTAGADTVEDGAKDIRAHQTYCEHTMEAAMRAMDMLVTDGVRWGVKSQEHTARTFWQDTKRECWAKP